MGFEQVKKILSALLALITLGFLYLFFIEPMFIKKSDIQIDQSFVIPDISIDKAFFDKIESLKNNTVTLDENSVVNNNPFSK